MSEQESNTPKWHKVLSWAGSAIFIIAVAAWNWNVIKETLFSDDIAAVQKVTAELMEESLNNDLEQLARVCEVKNVTLIKECGNSYKGTAKVVMQARTKDSTDDNIKYGGNPLTVTYSLKVIYDGNNVLLDDATMDNADFLKLIEAANVSLEALLSGQGSSKEESE